MAVLIPAFGSVKQRMRPSERRVAECLEVKLEDDYLLWYNVPVGHLQKHPDFIVLHPRRGLLILEVKDWDFKGYIQEAGKEYWRLLDPATGAIKTELSPFVQARNHVLAVVDCLKLDPQLRQVDMAFEGKLCCSWASGVVFPNITRKEWNDAGCGGVVEFEHVICKDEMTESVDAEAFQSRLWNMFPYATHHTLSLPQLDRIRGNLFPEIRIHKQVNLFADGEEGEDVWDAMRVMDVQQEQLARSLGDGHRVIHGVAGSGKTMILGYRAEYLSKASTKPVLILCFSRPLADKLAAVMRSKGLTDKVHVRSFHQWCREQLKAYGQTLPQHSPSTSTTEMFTLWVDKVIRAVELKHIPSGQYTAVLIDEGHDFRPEWLKLIVQMVDPATNSLLLLYDHAQSIFQKEKAKGISFKQVGIAAQGRTTILKINYRNTRQILQTANLVARELLSPTTADEDGIPLIRPITSGRDGDEAVIVRLPTLSDEWRRVTAQLVAAHEEGFAWQDMAILCRDKYRCEEATLELQKKNLPVESIDTHSGLDRIHILTMHKSKGLEFPVVVMPRMELMPNPRFDEKEEAQVFYVAATRATHKLIITACGDSKFMRHLLPLPSPQISHQTTQEKTP